MNTRILEGYEHMYYNMLHRNDFEEYRKTLDEEDDNIAANFRHSKEGKAFQEKKERAEVRQQDRLDRIIPNLREFTSLKEIGERVRQ